MTNFWGKRWRHEFANIVPLFPKKVDMVTEPTLIFLRDIKREGFLSKLI
jgi:hypothetical protein